MVHSANIGQYGESKSDDARRAREALNALDRSIKLGVLADGIGFRSNAGGLRSILENADEFFQFETLWKAAVVAAKVCEEQVTLMIPDAQAHGGFLERYRSTVSVVTELDERPGWTQAGEASIRPGQT